MITSYKISFSIAFGLNAEIVSYWTNIKYSLLLQVYCNKLLQLNCISMIRRNTPAKEAVLSVLSVTGKAMSQQAIEKRLTVDIDPVTIYRILNRFCDDGMLHKIVAEDGKQYFAVCTNCEERKKTQSHFHFRCKNCELMECLNEPVNFSVPSGYEVESVNCVLTGTCKQCAQLI
jgi:Fur family ferric uptake transcriptional regulator